ncbi:MAG TPA: methyltransferase domain-containing protein [Caldilineaceae bacterium]|nr:methyltransferase domain-containing protein [Caldilineaceae bacterium]
MANLLPDHPPPTTGDDYLDAAIAARRRWEARYAEGVTPWDTRQTPPEVVAFWQSGRLPHQGAALDLGCGPGANVLYMARLGLHATGVEIAGAPLLSALQRLQHEPAEVKRRIAFVCADVCALPWTSPAFNYILDVGCLHSLPPAVRARYAAGVISSLAPGGFYQLYAFDRRPEEGDDALSGPVGMAPGEVAALFAGAMQMVEEVEARPDRRPCRWYLLQKPPGPV